MEGLADHAARRASVASMQAVEAGDREGWLALFADDAVVEDPIGPSPFDPAGRGHHGRDAIAAFYDSVIAQGSVRFVIRESHAAGAECANVGTITTTFPDGTRAVVDGVYTYRVDGEGFLAALRAFWDVGAVRIEAPGG